MLLCGQQSINAHAIRHLGLIIALDLDVQNDAIIEFDEQIGDSLLDDRELDVQESADLASTGVSSKDARPVPLKQILDHRIVADRINPARSCWFGHDPSVETGGPVRPYPLVLEGDMLATSGRTLVLSSLLHSLRPGFFVAWKG